MYINTPGFVVESLPPIFPPLQVAHGSDTYPRAARRSQVGLDPHRMSAILFSSISGATWHMTINYTHTSSQTCDVMLYLLFLCITIKIWLFWSVGLSKHDQLSFFLFNLQTGNFSIRASPVLTVPLMVLGCIIFTGPTTYLSIWRASSHAHMKELIRKWVIPSKNKTKQLQKMISNTDNTF